jgi:hypothetical protein
MFTLAVTLHLHWINNAGPSWTLIIQRFAAHNKRNTLADFTEAAKYSNNTAFNTLTIYLMELETAVLIVLFTVMAYRFGRLVNTQRQM